MKCPNCGSVMTFDLHADQYGTSYNCMHCGYAEYSSMGGTSVMNPGRSNMACDEVSSRPRTKLKLKKKKDSDDIIPKLLESLQKEEDKEYLVY